MIDTTTKDKVSNAMEKFYIYGKTRNNNKINDECTVTPNIIFDTVILKDVDRTLVTLQPLVFSYVTQSQVPLTRTNT
jgi:hypothetical protein